MLARDDTATDPTNLRTRRRTSHAVSRVSIRVAYYCAVVRWYPLVRHRAYVGGRLISSPPDFSTHGSPDVVSSVRPAYTYMIAMVNGLIRRRSVWPTAIVRDEECSDRHSGPKGSVVFGFFFAFYY